MRRDGSSRFGVNNQYHNFGAIGAAWIFSEEKFFKENIRFLSFGKFKTSYGTTGSEQIGDYAFLDLYNPVSVEMPYQNTLGISPVEISNPQLQWEETRKFQVGLDLGFFNDNILFSITYSKNTSDNQLMGYSLPDFVGQESALHNFFR